MVFALGAPISPRQYNTCFLLVLVSSKALYQQEIAGALGHTFNWAIACRHGRKFQFFCKYYAAMMCALCGCIILSKDVPVIQQWSPLYVMITVIVVMSEKVDTTITKGE